MISVFPSRFAAMVCVLAALALASPITARAQVAAALSADKSAQMEQGRQLYLKNCFVCHQLNGQGTPGAFLPLAQSDFLAADKERAIRILCEGVSGEITVNGKKFDSIMPPVVLGDS
ncbi:MAG TPA: c-type cytochrome, partial [Verrucomicrobiae bacterium]|nr:c-type cytochrome [Verrucomicrobiae bacterium]